MHFTRTLPHPCSYPANRSLTLAARLDEYYRLGEGTVANTRREKSIRASGSFHCFVRDFLLAALRDGVRFTSRTAAHLLPSMAAMRPRVATCRFWCATRGLAQFKARCRCELRRLRPAFARSWGSNQSLWARSEPSVLRSCPDLILHECRSHPRRRRSCMWYQL